MSDEKQLIEELVLPPDPADAERPALDHGETQPGGEDVIVDARSPEELAEQSEEAHRQWFRNTYRGDAVPQLTFRAVAMGAILGSLMSISNLYTMIKLGWGFGVAITACVLSFVIWNVFRTLIPKLSPMTILENNCMQSTASAAGYSTGSTIATAFGACLLISGHHIDWKILVPWTLMTAALGVFVAVPLKRQMINRERLAFPSGIAAAETLNSLYSRSKESVRQAYSLVIALGVGGVVGFFRQGGIIVDKLFHFAMWQLPELLEFPSTVAGGTFPGFGFEPSVLMIAAGAITGMRVCLSMLIGSCLLYFVLGPWAVSQGAIVPGKLMSWSLWTGTALMVTSGITAFALQWKTIARAFSALKSSKASGSTDAEMEAIEVPAKWMIIGLVPLVIGMTILQFVAFGISIPLGFLAVIMSFALALVACRATGETDVTPISAMGKVTQLTYAALTPKPNAVTNLMSASVTANIAISSADLLTDLKSGYLLGANPRKQFIAQFIGIFFGTAAVVPAWYAMVPSKAVLESYNPPSTNVWRAVAEALTHGISSIHITAQYGILIGGLLGIALALVEHFYPKSRKFLPSAMGLGLSWVMVFSNSFSFFLGAAIASVWTRINKKNAEAYVVPIASGAIAGESLACGIIAIINAALAIAVK